VILFGEAGLRSARGLPSRRHTIAKPFAMQAGEGLASELTMSSRRTSVIVTVRV
jgi:hypothetical protein